MAELKKPKAKSRKGIRAYDVLAPFHCQSASFDFDVDTENFELEKFYKETGLSPSHKSWSTVFYAERLRAGYHVHFEGSITGKDMTLSLKYYGRSVTRTKSHLPFAETAMQWLGSFFKTPKAVPWIYVNFSKPNGSWRSRFNLPFRVTMSGTKAEVVIDGIALDLPHNAFGAERGWINKYRTTVDVAILLRRSIGFSRFSIEEELPVYNEAIGMFVEETKRRP